MCEITVQRYLQEIGRRPGAEVIAPAAVSIAAE
jgi:hypothetical protein